MAIKFQFRRDTTANWSSANPILSDGEFGLDTTLDQFKIGDGVTAYNSLPYGGITGPAQTNPIMGYGSGTDGDVTLSAGITTLTRNMYYNNLTLTGTARINVASYKIFIKGTFDITAAGVGAIYNEGIDGTNAATQTGGAAGAAIVATVNGASTAGSVGQTGVIGVGATSAAAVACSPGNGGGNALNGAGGAGVSGAGGAGSALVVPVTPLPVNHFQTDLSRGLALIQGGTGGRGGASGAGDGVVLGRGGGGGGSGGGIVQIFARKINRSGSTPAGCISVHGGRGGNGASAVAGNTGGGGGASGAGGGWIYLAYDELLGTTATNCLDASGGDGGAGGNGFGTGFGGSGGQGASGGRITVVNPINRTGSETVGNHAIGGSLGGTGIVNTGGSAGAGELLRVSL